MKRHPTLLFPAEARTYGVSTVLLGPDGRWRQGVLAAHALPRCFVTALEEMCVPRSCYASLNDVCDASNHIFVLRGISHSGRHRDFSLHIRVNIAVVVKCTRRGESELEGLVLRDIAR